MRHITNILLATATIISILAFFTSCSNEDNIEEIFIGRTWYMNGATVNGLKLNSDIKNFYTSAGPTRLLHFLRSLHLQRCHDRR